MRESISSLHTMGALALLLLAGPLLASARQGRAYTEFDPPVVKPLREQVSKE